MREPVLLSVVALWLAGGAAAQAPDEKKSPQKISALGAEAVPQKDYPQRYSQSLKGEDKTPDDWNFYSQRPGEFVHLEPEGLRITLPPGGENKMQSIGAGSVFGLKGDFEITLRFEILKDPDPADVGKAGTRLTLQLSLDTPLAGTPNEEAASLSRTMATRGFSAWIRNRHSPAPLQTALPIPATTGRLRLVRSGEDLFYLVSVGPDQPFQLLAKYRFGTEDVRKILIYGTTGGEKAWFDLRVSDLLIRADAILAAPGEPAAAAAPPGKSGRGWLLATLLVMLMTAALLTLGLLMRKRGGA